MPPAFTGHGIYLLNPLMGLVWLLIGLLIAFYVYSDSSKRYPRGSLAPLIWTVAVVFGGLLVLLLYLLVRPPERRD
ncbi:hypothetical protein Pyrde_0947 [Pyrodictium delaneyi]|uniref:Cardiolipin synthase N-terminal domain-containing protein n=1 Tax=Pyrodictium delaneyi TaxID=1273541 RepID=A0A0P0N2R7_9CREN|nr:hypothetical protein [Pyrodictium delaneyi]ALL00995.1 hypothetical protein Pyrde_0947 [Pyrodictium delaneyi]OWJ55401.1 hypothetical protein Pdsh_00905 [Pyrodictium delaneyi]